MVSAAWYASSTAAAGAAVAAFCRSTMGLINPVVAEPVRLGPGSAVVLRAPWRPRR
ncbi:Uncharacterised protein [Mycobacteroides abscessus subsp. abscessus]|nr:Uncharacterised protein [Mycobacteroides abscessus]SHV59103.1 Uncharacterised protein [Mycobacteroides abscessus subsp. abscessus]